MIIILLIAILLLIGITTPSKYGNSESGMSEYCRLECKERKIPDKSICC